VPASRAELFADKALPLAAKRCLGRFLAACVEAQQGCGRLKVRLLTWLLS
jgi:RAB protein geranylgeranyltransferase component A